jgi:hypothetical protein
MWQCRCAVTRLGVVMRAYGVKSFLFGSDFEDESEVALRSHLIRYWKLSDIGRVSCWMTAIWKLSADCNLSED